MTERRQNPNRRGNREHRTMVRTAAESSKGDVERRRRKASSIVAAAAVAQAGTGQDVILFDSTRLDST